MVNGKWRIENVLWSLLGVSKNKVCFCFDGER